VSTGIALDNDALSGVGQFGAPLEGLTLGVLDLHLVDPLHLHVATVELAAHSVATKGGSIDAEEVLLGLLLEFDLRQGRQLLTGLVLDSLEVAHHLVLVGINLHDPAGVAIHQKAFRHKLNTLSICVRINWVTIIN